MVSVHIMLVPAGEGIGRGAVTGIRSKQDGAVFRIESITRRKVNSTGDGLLRCATGSRIYRKQVGLPSFGWTSTATCCKVCI